MITFKNLGRHGRISNQMFQIASCIGIATEHGYEYGFPYWMNWDQLERFGGGEDIDIQQFFKNPLPLINESIQYKDHTIPWGYHDVGVSDNTNIIGHMQSEKYFLHCADIIRHYFKFAHETEKQSNTLAVHFRGGDYGGSYHPTCTKEYYQKAFEQMPKGLRVLLFTDDPTRASKVMPFDYELVEGNHSMIDMEIMSKCDHHIIANSTFSWWGTWLARSKKVVAPSLWFGPDARGLETRDIYPDSWIIL